PNIFSESRAGGANAALTGWFHPYCRISGIAASLTRCHWQDGGILLGEIRRDASIPTSMLDELLDIPTVTWELRHLPGFISAGERERTEELHDYQELVPLGIQDAADPALSLVVLHLPVPHPHGIYDRKTGRFSTAETHGYLDNLALADRTLGELRAAMERSGVWKDSVVIASADHWWRSEFWSTHFGWAPDDDRALAPLDHRIPFLVRFPDLQTKDAHARSYAPQFNTVLTHDLVLAIFRGEVQDAAGAAAWLDAHKTIGDSPYSVYKK
ncbi:MAG: LTA synthase family protein, partial [Acidobacteriota bacterium]|nr:LTA synthase family protein [Acidobacteriota bacterium]